MFLMRLGSGAAGAAPRPGIMPGIGAIWPGAAPKPPGDMPPAGNVGIPGAVPGIGPPNGCIPKPIEGPLDAGAKGAEDGFPMLAKGSKAPGPIAVFAVADVAKGSKLPMTGGAAGGADGAEGVGASKKPPDKPAAGAGDGPDGGGGARLAGMLAAGAGAGFGAAFPTPAKSRDSKSCGSASLLGLPLGSAAWVSAPPRAWPASA
mmetsp:Transcript_77854/g.206655  ORF Transcript_77854/g.206655 Transcript_77854/m.206655 type:complete len:204 (-) Transcript_77854:831-1442(-)